MSLVDSALSNFCTSFEAYKLNLASIIEMIQDEQMKKDFIKFLTKGKSKRSKKKVITASIENSDPGLDICFREIVEGKGYNQENKKLYESKVHIKADNVLKSYSRQCRRT